MKCSEPIFLSIREKPYLQLDDSQFIVKIGLINNLHYWLYILKQQQEKIIQNSDADTDPGLSFDFINKHPLLKIWFFIINELTMRIIIVKINMVF